MPDIGNVAALVSCAPHFPQWIDGVVPETKTIFAPSQRAAVIPFNVFKRPGPVVANTRFGSFDAKYASTAVNAAPLSWRQWTTWIALFFSAWANAALAPPMIPNP